MDTPLAASLSWFGGEIYGGTVGQWGVALCIGIIVALALNFVRGILVQRLQAHASRTVTRVDDIIADVLAGTHLLFFLVVALYISTQAFDLPPKIARIADHIVVLALLLQAALWGNRAVKGWLADTVTRRGPDTTGVITVSAIGFIARVVLWSVVTLMMLDNVGVDITALVASLGIGGIAVALAVQNILGDIFASLSIALDKPFVVGDFIIVDQEMGVVEYVGLKTTRLRSLSGEQIVLANADLLKSRIRNYKRMIERRVLFGFGVVYETPADTLEQIPSTVRGIVEAQPHTRFDRAHFKSYGDFSLDFEVVYYVCNPDYNVYMDIQQAINLALFRQFQAQNIAFAYPTRTVYLQDTKVATTAKSS